MNNISQFEKLLPKIRNLSPQRNPINTLYFEGLHGIKEALYYRLDKLHGETISGFYAKGSNLDDNTLDLFDKWGRQNTKNNNIFTGISPNHESIQKLKGTHPNEYKNIILIPEEEYSSEISIDVVSDFVRIIDAHDLKGVIIENKRVAETLKQIVKIVEKRYKIDI